MTEGKKHQGTYIGMPEGLWLHEFGSVVWDAYGHPPYLVGSALRTTDYRDVDVRLLLPDEEYAAMFPGCDPKQPNWNGKWSAHVRAFSELGRRMTGLRIDFQIQQQTQANLDYPESRSALGFIGLRMAPLLAADDADEKEKQVESESV